MATWTDDVVQAHRTVITLQGCMVKRGYGSQDHSSAGLRMIGDSMPRLQQVRVLSLNQKFITVTSSIPTKLFRWSVLVLNNSKPEYFSVVNYLHQWPF